MLLRLVARDLAHGLGVDDAAAELADLAAGTLEAALAIARREVGESADLVRLAVIAMGKCGGRELNYVSDVDVIFVHEPADGADETAATRAATQLASQLMRVCTDPTAEGTLWQVDAALRPEGKAGPLSRTLASHAGYYERWAQTWEFQALLKARPVAGDLALGREYVELVSPMVWRAAEREGFVADTQAMRRRVLEHIPARDADRQLKLGAGGLRDVEFAVQLLQLVHGRADPSLRAGATLSALADLTRGGYVGREDGEALHEAYAFLRTLEHRIQLHQLRRTHVVPSDEAALRRLGRSMGMFKGSVADAGPRPGSTTAARSADSTRSSSTGRCLAAVAKIPGPEVRLSSEAAGDRLAALGYADPKAALRNLEALSSGVTRTASIQKALLPAMLQWFAEGPDPDAGLFGFRRLSETLGRTPWYLKTLRDEGQVAERLAHLLATSRYVTDLLEREPQGVRMLADDLVAALRRGDDRGDAGQRRPARGRRREGDPRGARGPPGASCCGSPPATFSAWSTSPTSGSGSRDSPTPRSRPPLPWPAAQCASSASWRPRRPGSRSWRWAATAGSSSPTAPMPTCLFVHEAEDGADAHEATTYATAVANELRRMLAAPGGDPPLEVDADLRPGGQAGRA